MTDLGVLPGMSASTPIAINDADQVVGWSDGSGAGRAFFWSPTTGMTDIAGWPNGGNAVPTDINNVGQIIGYTPGQTPNTPDGFVWTAANGPVFLGGFADWPHSVPNAINDSGVVAGYSGTHPFRWTSGKGMEALPVPVGDFGEVVDINDAGETAGFTGTSGHDLLMRALSWQADNQIDSVFCCPAQGRSINRDREITGTLQFRTAYLWTPSTGVRELGNLPGMNTSSGVAINDSGQVTGNSSTSFIFRVFIWSEATGMRDLGSLPDKPVCFARAINNRGHVVGFCQ
jgi:probable HAF family extracellular repeat protein